MSIMKRLAGPAYLTGAAADILTVPAGKRWTIRVWRICNGQSSDYTFTLSVGTDAADKRVYDDTTMPAKKSAKLDENLTLEAGEKIQGFASTTNKLVLTVNGVEDTI